MAPTLAGLLAGHWIQSARRRAVTAWGLAAMGAVGLGAGLLCIRAWTVDRRRLADQSGCVDPETSRALDHLRTDLRQEIHASAAETRAYIDQKVDTSAAETRAYIDQKVETSAIETRAYIDQKVDTSAAETRAYIDQKVDTSAVETRAYIDQKVDTSAAETRAYIDQKVDTSAAETRAYIDQKVDTSAAETRGYIDQKVETSAAETRRHAGVLIEDLRGHIQVVAEGVMALNHKFDVVRVDQDRTNRRLDLLEGRVTVLEQARRPPRRP
jgi:hypothetical protein